MSGETTKDAGVLGRDEGVALSLVRAMGTRVGIYIHDGSAGGWG